MHESIEKVISQDLNKMIPVIKDKKEEFVKTVAEWFLIRDLKYACQFIREKGKEGWAITRDVNDYWESDGLDLYEYDDGSLELDFTKFLENNVVSSVTECFRYSFRVSTDGVVIESFTIDASLMDVSFVDLLDSVENEFEFRP